MVEGSLELLIEQNGWFDIPKDSITREGNKLKTKGNIWHLPYATRGNASLDFNKVLNHKICWALKRYVFDRIQVTSTHAGYSAFQDIWREILRYQIKYKLNNSINTENAKSNLIRLIEDKISSSRSKHKLWALYRPIQWYIWCADNYPELGFCNEYATQLESITLPGNPKGEAVRIEDPDCGPLHRSLELPLVISALKQDTSLKLEHLQQKAAVALSIALGRNPANLTYLRCTDLINLSPEGTEPCYCINIPRIKKRQRHPRDDLLEEYLDTEFANYINQLIDANKAISTTLCIDGKNIAIEKSLFINVKKNRAAIASGLFQDSFNMTSEDISKLIQKFVKRHNIISPITGKLLHLSTRRLRYTLATSLAAEGISQRELARILDHTDTQHVQVYFELAGSIVERLDKAVAKKFSKYLNFFRGKVIENNKEAINGEREDKHLSFVYEEDPSDQTEIGICGESSICHLDPPFSCYLCPKFQPYKQADHDHVLECLLNSRDVRMEKYENSRLGIQLDHVIVAVAEVSEICKSGAKNV